eukprot:4284355-Amphidinium_carterae.1
MGDETQPESQVANVEGSTRLSSMSKMPPGQLKSVAWSAAKGTVVELSHSVRQTKEPWDHQSRTSLLLHRTPQNRHTTCLKKLLTSGGLPSCDKDNWPVAGRGSARHGMRHAFDR